MAATGVRRGTIAAILQPTGDHANDYLRVVVRLNSDNQDR